MANWEEGLQQTRGACEVWKKEAAIGEIIVFAPGLDPIYAPVFGPNFGPAKLWQCCLDRFFYFLSAMILRRTSKD